MTVEIWIKKTNNGYCKIGKNTYCLYCMDGDHDFCMWFKSYEDGSEYHCDCDCDTEEKGDE